MERRQRGRPDDGEAVAHGPRADLGDEARLRAGLERPAPREHADARAGRARAGRDEPRVDDRGGVEARDVEARLGLFLGVCDAVAYAHRHLVVHRDLKPANVLAADAEAGPRVTLLDFGIARLLAEDGPDGGDEALTQTNQRMLTPAYAAPEQRAGHAATTATDVYALGVLLYQLLVGHTPDRAATDASGPATPTGTARVVRPSVAAAALPDAPRRARALRGDLDTVVLKALRDEPERRYASAAEFADDVRRHLAHEPVRARPDTPGYRARRFVRRHRAGAGAFAVVVLAVVGGAAAARWQAGVARAEEAKATATLAFFQSTLYTATPGGALPDGTLRAGLDSAAAHVDRDLAGQPLVAAAVHSTVGLSYYTLGAYDRAERHQRRAAALFARAGRAARLDHGVELQNLAVTLTSQGRPAEALPLLRRSAVIQRALGTPYQQGSALNATAIALDDLGRRDEAETAYLEAIAIWRREQAAELPLALNNLAILYEGTRRAREAVPLVEEAAAALRAQGATADSRLGPVLATLGSLYDYTGRPAEAAATLDTALAVLRRSVGTDHPLTVQNRASRALVDVRAGRPALALPLARQALRDARRTLPADHPITPHVLVVLAEALCAADSARTGEPLAREALATRRALYPPEHALVAVTESVEGACLAALGRHAEARPLLVHGLAALRADRGDADARTADARERLTAFDAARGGPPAPRRPRGSRP